MSVESAPLVFDFHSTYTFLHEGAAVTPLEITPDFWANIQNRTDLHNGRMISVFQQSVGAWPHWEMHPAGEEVIYLLSGALTLTLEYPDGERRSVEMQPRNGIIIPRGTWHWAEVHEAGDLLVITYGAGTQTRPV
jgi:oxalate decarboxylase/phosphoglucose isomerase-like protein (cupin superfamily)